MLQTDKIFIHREVLYKQGKDFSFLFCKKSFDLLCILSY